MDENNFPKHIAIIMDGNRRWARENNLNSSLGHKKGAQVMENITKYCNKIGIKYLTLYTFSTENWKRTSEEVGALMLLLEEYLDRFLKKVDLDNIKIKIIGDKESKNIPDSIRKKMCKMEEKTKNNTGLILNIVFNYGGRAEIIRATKLIAQKVKNGEIEIDDIDEKQFSDNLYTAGQDDPDLLIRTSGELRTSNFLPWQITYTEFLFLEKFWPDFTEEDIDNAIKIYQKRQRRVGK